jgi:transcriptional regulator with XRE-family HTH domain
MLIKNAREGFRELDSYRKEKRITVKDVCDILKISRSSYYRYVNNYKSTMPNPSVKILNEYANMLDLEIVFLAKQKLDNF